MANTIELKKYGDNVIKEITGSGTIYPGMLLERTYSSGSKVKAHSNAGQNAQPLFAIEDALQGNDIDDAYSSGALVRCEYFRSGDEVNAILADGESVTVGDFLESNGAGYLRKHSADSAGVVEYPECIVAVALEVKDLSGSSGEESSGTPLGYNKRIKVEII